MTHYTKTQSRIATTVAALALLTASAYAGASSYRADTQAETEKIALSPAEIRNAVSISMDELELQGIDVDRAAVDGIGLDADDRYAELRLP